MLVNIGRQLLEAASRRVRESIDLQPAVLWTLAQSAAKASILLQLEAKVAAAAVGLAAAQKVDQEAEASCPVVSTPQSPR